jgi:hypothetical protein
MSLYQSLNKDCGMYFDVASACLAVISAAMWLASARVNFTFGFDMDAALSQQMKRASGLNAWGATFAAVAAVVVAAKTFLVAS